MGQITKLFIQQSHKNPDIDLENEGVELYCSDFKDNSARNTKSYVFHRDELFLASCSYSIELGKEECDCLKFKNCRFFEAHEGTVIKVFNINNKWYTATNRRLNAFNSKWAARNTTFGIFFAAAVEENIRKVDDDEIFEDDIPKSLDQRKKEAKEYLNSIYESNFDKTKKYIFLLKPCKEERIVCETQSPKIFNIGVFDKDNNFSNDEKIIIENFTVPRPTELFFDNKEQMIEALSDINPMNLQGFVAIQKEGSEDKHYKIFNDEYKYYFNLRNNRPSLRFRFLELCHENTMSNIKNYTNQNNKKIIDFTELYKDDFDPHEVLEYIWSRIVVDLFRLYEAQYIKKLPVTILTDKQEYILEVVHSHFLNSGKRLPTNHQRISDLLAIQKPSILNQLLGEYEKKDKIMKKENTNS